MLVCHGVDLLTCSFKKKKKKIEVSSLSPPNDIVAVALKEIC